MRKTIAHIAKAMAELKQAIDASTDPVVTLDLISRHDNLLLLNERLIDRWHDTEARTIAL